MISADLKAQNFVLNGGFEDLTMIPSDLGNFYAREWYIIRRGTSPDIYSMNAVTNTAANPDWSYCQVKPMEGSSFAGIILEDRKEDYREPIGTKLGTYLREDSTYLLRISVAIPKISSYRISSMDVILSKSIVTDQDNLSTHFSIPLDSVKDDLSWHTFSFEFQAKGGERFLSIGNFQPRKALKLIALPNRNEMYHKTLYTQAYVCLDNIELFDMALMQGQQSESQQAQAPEELFQPITLKNLLFEVGSSMLQHTDIPELDKLAGILEAHESVSVLISGHTDNSGDAEENKKLSLERAKSVAAYLIDKGIDESRITIQGKGAEVPLVSNDTEEGRYQNRRVVVEFLK